jgi:hypothetical protein
MHYAKKLFFICLILIVTGCAPAPTVTATHTSTPAMTLPPSTTTPTKTVESPALQAGQWAYIFYHDGLEQVMMVNGGPERGKPADEPLELWGWDGTGWSLIAADQDGPTWRNWPAVAYDTARDVLVIHGGLQSGNHFDETWEWDGKIWQRFTGIDGREGALMAYDEARAKMVLFGGSDSTMKIHGGTWEWDGQSWIQVSESGPAPRFPGAMLYDPEREAILLYSGHFAELSGGSIDYDDLWAWDGSAWRELTVDGLTPGHRTHAGFVYDPVTQNVLLISSGNDTFLSDMWAWDGAQWKELPTANTPARSGSNVAYDPKRDRFILFGGVDRPGARALDDTWEWDREQWTCVNNCK